MTIDEVDALLAELRQPTPHEAVEHCRAAFLDFLVEYARADRIVKDAVNCAKPGASEARSDLDRVLILFAKLNLSMPHGANPEHRRGVDWLDSFAIGDLSRKESD